jgi:hypothetical protein
MLQFCSSRLYKGQGKGKRALITQKKYPIEFSCISNHPSLACLETFGDQKGGRGDGYLHSRGGIKLKQSIPWL